MTYAEGEYNHPMAPDVRLRLAPGRHHWRNWLPSTYYCTHALAPLTYVTGSMPRAVNALSIAAPEVGDLTMRRGDPGSVILCRMDDGSVFRIFGLVLPGHSNWYRVHGTRGAMEIARGPGYFGPGQVRVWHEPWNRWPDQPLERSYLPEWPEHAESAERAGHGGGDFWTSHHFAQAIRSGAQPFLDVYRAVAMSSVGILAWRSALQHGQPVEVPDFADENQRARHQHDTWSPWPGGAEPPDAPPSIMADREPTPEATARAKEIWNEMGYGRNR